MNEAYLEITYRHGHPLAAYYYLPRKHGQKSYRTEQAAPGLIVDYGRGGQPLGIEIAAPSRVTLTAINRVLKKIGQRPVARAELAPIFAA